MKKIFLGLQLLIAVGLFADYGQRILDIKTDLEQAEGQYREEEARIRTDLEGLLSQMETSRIDFIPLVEDFADEGILISQLKGLEGDRQDRLETILSDEEWTQEDEILSLLEGLALQRIGLENTAYQLEILDRYQFSGMSEEALKVPLERFFVLSQEKAGIAPWWGRSLAEGLHEDLFTLYGEMAAIEPQPFTIEYIRRVEGIMQRACDSGMPVQTLFDHYRETIEVLSGARYRDDVQMTPPQRVLALERFSLWWYRLLSQDSLCGQVDYLSANPIPGSIAARIIGEGFDPAVAEACQMISRLKENDLRLEETAERIALFDRWEDLNPLVYTTYADGAEIPDHSGPANLFSIASQQQILRETCLLILDMPEWAWSYTGNLPGLSRLSAVVEDLNSLQQIFLARELDLPVTMMRSLSWRIPR